MALASRAGLPPRYVQNTLDGKEPRVNRGAEICEALGLEFYIGPPRPKLRSDDSCAPLFIPLPELERSTRSLVRLTSDAGGDSIPDDLWPVLAARRREVATKGEADRGLADPEALAEGQPAEIIDFPGATPPPAALSA